MITKRKTYSTNGGNIPVIADLAKGELALNTYDGITYFKKTDNTLASFRASPAYLELVDINERDTLASGSTLNEGDWVRYLHGAYYRIEMWYNGKWYLIEEQPPKFLMVVTMLSTKGPGFKNVIGGDLTIVEKSDNNWEVSSPDAIERIQFDANKTEVSSIFIRVSEDLTTMESIFEGCSNLSGGNITKLKTSKVTTMKAAFKNCSSLSGVQDLPFDAGNVIDMSDMFNGCSSMTVARLAFTFAGSGARVANTSRMFLNCNAMTCIEHVNTTAAGGNTTDMFSGTSQLANPNSVSRDEITSVTGANWTYTC